jgi:hypothetical protein
LQFLIKKRKRKIFSCIFSVFVIKTLDLDSEPDSLEMLDPEPDSLEMLDPEPDPQHWYGTWTGERFNTRIWLWVPYWSGGIMYRFLPSDIQTVFKRMQQWLPEGKAVKATVPHRCRPGLAVRQHRRQIIRVVQAEGGRRHHPAAVSVPRERSRIKRRPKSTEGFNVVLRIRTRDPVPFWPLPWIRDG